MLGEYWNTFLPMYTAWEGSVFQVSDAASLSRCRSWWGGIPRYLAVPGSAH